MINLNLTEQQLESLHMALDLAYTQVLSRLQTAEIGSTRMAVLSSQRKHFDELTSLVVKQLDQLNKETI